MNKVLQSHKLGLFNAANASLNLLNGVVVDILPPEISIFASSERRPVEDWIPRPRSKFADSRTVRMARTKVRTLPRRRYVTCVL